ncbi:MAG: hypothetical protein N2037_12925, partial [Acidimicrobiales bacterium]|nr:hypothetical protein [Acidimicrobiales bacterium]
MRQISLRASDSFSIAPAKTTQRAPEADARDLPGIAGWASDDPAHASQTVAGWGQIPTSVIARQHRS